MNGNVIVKSLGQARRIKRKVGAVVTIEDPGRRNGLRYHSAPHPDHLVLRFEDVDVADESVALPRPDHVRSVLEFARQNTEGKLLVHCKAGVARSTALALAVMADRMGAGREADAVEELLRVRPESAPNLLLLGFADDVLERGGALRGAWDEVESAHAHYAEHREKKLEILRRQPHLFARAGDRPLPAMRYRPRTTKPEFASID